MSVCLCVCVRVCVCLYRRRCVADKTHACAGANAYPNEMYVFIASADERLKKNEFRVPVGM